jgi:hypothetical protein
MQSSTLKSVLVMIGMGVITLTLQVSSTVLQVGYQPTLDALRNAKFCKRNVPEQNQNQQMASRAPVNDLIVEIVEDAR